ncbi:hypothetical protein BD408DRAFT_411393 [Parasitella parasitica]|nr:hypothetical protein BD408DRAFT_411393 [Parasitella parasitica]
MVLECARYNKLRIGKDRKTSWIRSAKVFKKIVLAFYNIPITFQVFLQQVSIVFGFHSILLTFNKQYEHS